MYYETSYYHLVAAISTIPIPERNRDLKESHAIHAIMQNSLRVLIEKFKEIVAKKINKYQSKSCFMNEELTWWSTSFKTLNVIGSL